MPQVSRLGVQQLSSRAALSPSETENYSVCLGGRGWGVESKGCVYTPELGPRNEWARDGQADKKNTEWMRDCKFPSKTKRLCTSVETLTIEKPFPTGIAPYKENVNPELMGDLR